MEHAPFRGTRYGTDGKLAIAIMGYTHHGDPTRDDASKTVDVLSDVIDGNHPPTQFFRQLASYFGESRDDFWNDVAFFNFGSRVVGDSARKYGRLTGGELTEARARFVQVLEQLQPDMLFVFTRAGWDALPPTEEDQRGTSGQELVAGQHFDRHHYRLDTGKIVQAFGLRHPERATKALMAQAVAVALAMKASAPA